MTGERAGDPVGAHDRIPFLIRRSARRATVSVAVEPPVRSLSPAPIGISVERLNASFARRLERWWSDVRPGSRTLTPRDARVRLGGDSALRRAADYGLRVIEAAKKAQERLERGWLVVTVERNFTSKERAGAVRAAF